MKNNTSIFAIRSGDYPRSFQNKLLIAVSWFMLSLLFACEVSAQAKSLEWTSKVGAKQFPAGTKVYTVPAASDTSKIITRLIQNTIDQCAEKGGGIVRFKPGTYVTGAIFVRPGVQLAIDKNVLILGSQNFEDYPEIDTRVAGIEMKWPAALINFIDVKNAALTGAGIVNARGKFCWDKYWATRKEY